MLHRELLVAPLTERVESELHSYSRVPNVYNAEITFFCPTFVFTSDTLAARRQFFCRLGRSFRFARGKGKSDTRRDKSRARVKIRASHPLDLACNGASRVKIRFFFCARAALRIAYLVKVMLRAPKIHTSENWCTYTSVTLYALAFLPLA